jgi:hypothetical protein
MSSNITFCGWGKNSAPRARRKNQVSCYSRCRPVRNALRAYEASAAPDRAEALANLLNIIGQRVGTRSIIKLG